MQQLNDEKESEFKYKLSVLMSTYNGKDYIYEQLESLRNQTRKADEVIIIDDRSTDNTVEIITKYINEYSLQSSWKLIKNEVNKGWRQNFITGISETNGDIVFFSDQDDIWFNNKLEVYEKIFADYQSVNVLASHEVTWNGTEDIKQTFIKNSDFKWIYLLNNSRDYLIQCSGCTMAFRRSYFENIRKFYVEKWAHDDFLWKNSVIDGSMALLNDCSVLHRIHGDNESRKKRNLESTVEFLDIDLNICDSLIKRVNEDSHIKKREKILHILKHKYEGMNLRKKSFQEKNLFISLFLAMKYSDIYRRKRQIVGDVLLYLNIMRSKK